MKKVTLVLIIMLSFSCKPTPKDFLKGEGDLLYLMHDDVAGETIMPGDFMALSMREQTEEGEVLYNSADYDGRAVYRFREPSRFKGDFFSGIAMLSEGDSATIKVNLDSMKKVVGITIPKAEGKYLVYEVKVFKVIARGNLNDKVFNQKMEAYKLAAAEKARIEEADKIERYLKQERLQTTLLPSGINYVLLNKGEGDVGKSGDTLKVNFTISYLGGKVFETTSSHGPVKFLVSTTPTFGFGETLGLFPKGTKAKLVIPSKLAYGNHYYRDLGPYTPLVCNLEVLEVIKPKPK